MQGGEKLRSVVWLDAINAHEARENVSEVPYGEEHSLALVSQLISAHSACLEGILARSRTIHRMFLEVDEK